MNADATIRAVAAVKAETPLQSGADHGSSSRNAEDAERQARYRLVIEQGPRAGSFVYKTLDRETGEIVRQLPSEEVLKLRERDDYGVGAVINTTA
ncbi:flagellar protein FlaG [Brevundimonas sp. UBA2416]|uniref:flagellar protein FlaG n=1 Tax=Brevundimonas sp. UBA2416 TaxID=1946124 RepID=UPI0025C3C828|nr:flagellar protein FlaG [Brevundimonas sp. UBA2416]HRJ63393.1 flagellar protein FlaG [Brevundimonas sp.]